MFEKSCMNIKYVNKYEVCGNFLFFFFITFYYFDRKLFLSVWKMIADRAYKNTLENL